MLARGRGFIGPSGLIFILSMFSPSDWCESAALSEYVSHYPQTYSAVWVEPTMHSWPLLTSTYSPDPNSVLRAHCNLCCKCISPEDLRVMVGSLVNKDEEAFNKDPLLSTAGPTM